MKNLPKAYQAVIALVLIVAIGLVFGNISVELDEQGLTAKALGVRSFYLPFDQITGLELREASTVDRGSRILGVSSFRGKAGVFSNGEFGRYRCYSAAKAGYYIVIFYPETDELTGRDHNTLLLSLPDDKKTEELYTVLQQKTVCLSPEV